MSLCDQQFFGCDARVSVAMVGGWATPLPSVAGRRMEYHHHPPPTTTIATHSLLPPHTSFTNTTTTPPHTHPCAGLSGDFEPSLVQHLFRNLRLKLCSCFFVIFIHPFKNEKFHSSLFVSFFCGEEWRRRDGWCCFLFFQKESRNQDI